MRDLGAKSKAKLELVKSSTQNKNEMKQKMLRLATDLKVGAENILTQENGALLHLLGAWGKEWEGIMNEVIDVKKEVYTKAGGWISAGEGVFVNLSELLSTAKDVVEGGGERRKGYTISGERASSQRSFSSDRKKKVSNSPVVKRVEELVREEKKFVNLLASIQNIFYPALKAMDSAWTTSQNEMIERVFCEKLGGVLDFHQRLLRGLEKVVKGWVGGEKGRGGGNGLGFSLGPLCSVLGEMFSSEGLRDVDKYLEFMPFLLVFLEQMGVCGFFFFFFFFFSFSFFFLLFLSTHFAPPPRKKNPGKPPVDKFNKNKP